MLFGKSVSSQELFHYSLWHPRTGNLCADDSKLHFVREDRAKYSGNRKHNPGSSKRASLWKDQIVVHGLIFITVPMPDTRASSMLLKNVHRGWSGTVPALVGPRGIQDVNEWGPAKREPQRRTMGKCIRKVCAVVEMKESEIETRKMTSC